VRQPVEAVQGGGELAGRAGLVERIAGLAQAQGAAVQGHQAVQQLATALGIDRAGIVRMGGQADGRGRLIAARCGGEPNHSRSTGCP
jgi:hypothetical protein